MQVTVIRTICVDSVRATPLMLQHKCTIGCKWGKASGIEVGNILGFIEDAVRMIAESLTTA